MTPFVSWSFCTGDHVLHRNLGQGVYVCGIRPLLDGKRVVYVRFNPNAPKDWTEVMNDDLLPASWADEVSVAPSTPDECEMASSYRQHGFKSLVADGAMTQAQADATSKMLDDFYSPSVKSDTE